MHTLALGALVLAVVVLAVAYEKGELNPWLPTSWQKSTQWLPIGGQKSTFVGAYGRYPAMQYCLAFDENHGKRQSHFNRCGWA